MADAKPAVERLSEDESLRGDLSDIGFGPLLDWAVAAVEKYAPQVADGDALDAYTSRVRGVVQSAVQAAQDSKLDDTEALLDFDPADKEKLTAVLKAITFGDDPDDNAVQIASALQSGLSTDASQSAPAQESTQSNSTDNTPAPEEPKQETTPAESTPSPAPEPAQEASQPTAPVAEPAQEVTPSPQPEQKKNEEQGASVSPPQEAVQPPPANQNLNPNPETSNQDTPVHAESSTTIDVSTPNQDAVAMQPPAPKQDAPQAPRPTAFFDTLRSTVGQAANSAWGLFKGFNKRRSG